ncbi:hypothetical protein F5X96DRAFT_632894 [Biscogniauxia mediterranea]|nr:hypothetical protein F5X96DRAFT_632894 [Biscogniauxia mediterranea]
MSFFLLRQWMAIWSVSPCFPMSPQYGNGTISQCCPTQKKTMVLRGLACDQHHAIRARSEKILRKRSLKKTPSPPKYRLLIEYL